eukprot:gene28727-35649_t
MNTADNSPSQPSSPPSAAKKAKPTKSGFNFTAALKPAAKVAEQKDAAQEAQASTKPKVAEGSAGDTSTVKPETAASSNGSASMPAQPQPSMSMESPEPSTVPSVVFGQPPLPSDGASGFPDPAVDTAQLQNSKGTDLLCWLSSPEGYDRGLGTGGPEGL